MLHSLAYLSNGYSLSLPTRYADMPTLFAYSQFSNAMTDADKYSPVSVKYVNGCFANWPTVEPSASPPLVYGVGFEMVCAGLTGIFARRSMHEC